MPHSQSFEALILKTYDVGEADRLCVLLTRERGRIMARASGARRPKSKLGGSLLPFRHVRLELKESGPGWMVAGVVRLDHDIAEAMTIESFAIIEEGVELLLRLVQHEGAIPDVFDATCAFLRAGYEGVACAELGYAFALLHHLGLLPAEEDLNALLALHPAEHGYIQSAQAGRFLAPDPACRREELRRLLAMLLENELRSPLKVAGVLEAMR